nr:L protein [Teschovirus A]
MEFLYGNAGLDLCCLTGSRLAVCTLYSQLKLTMACLKIFSLKRKDKSHSYSPREIELKYNSDFAFKPRPLAPLLRLEPSDTTTRRIECAEVEYDLWYPNPLDPASLVCDVKLEMLRFQ